MEGGVGGRGAGEVNPSQRKDAGWVGEVVGRRGSEVAACLPAFWEGYGWQGGWGGHGERGSDRARGREHPPLSSPLLLLPRPTAPILPPPPSTLLLPLPAAACR